MSLPLDWGMMTDARGMKNNDDRGLMGIFANGPPNQFDRQNTLNMNKIERISTQIVFLSELTMIITHGLVTVLVTESQQIETLIFKEASQMSSFVNQLTTNYLDTMKRSLKVLNMAGREAHSLRSQIGFINWPQCDRQGCKCEKTCFQMNLASWRPHQTFPTPCSLQIDQNRLYEVDQASGYPVRQVFLSSLEQIQVVDDDPRCNLELTFADKIILRLIAHSQADRERIVSSLVTLRTLSMQMRSVDPMAATYSVSLGNSTNSSTVANHLNGKQFVDPLCVFQNQILDKSQKILGYRSAEKLAFNTGKSSNNNFVSQVAQDYEQGLIKSLGDQLASHAKD